MKTCKKCNSKNIRSRVNYPHGKNSNAITSLSCKDCGCSDIEVKFDNRRYNKFKK